MEAFGLKHQTWKSERKISEKFYTIIHSTGETYAIFHLLLAVVKIIYAFLNVPSRFPSMKTNRSSSTILVLL